MQDQYYTDQQDYEYSDPNQRGLYTQNQTQTRKRQQMSPRHQRYSTAQDDMNKFLQADPATSSTNQTFDQKFAQMQVSGNTQGPVPVNPSAYVPAQAQRLIQQPQYVQPVKTYVA